MNKVKLPLVIVLSMLLFSSCATLSGHYYSLNDARKNDQYAKYYDDESLIFTKELSDGAVDFIIAGDMLHIVCIVKTVKTNKDLFNAKSAASFNVSEQIQYFEENAQYDFHNSTKLSALQYSWCIVTKQYNESNDNFDSFEFEYNNQLYHLCIKV